MYDIAVSFKPQNTQSIAFYFELDNCKDSIVINLHFILFTIRFSFVMSWIKLCALAFWLYHVMINVFSTSSNVQLLKRQARDERGKSIDLNREATPEPDLSASQSVSHVSPSTKSSNPRPYTLSGKKEPRFRLPRTYKKIEVPVCIKSRKI